MSTRPLGEVSSTVTVAGGSALIDSIHCPVTTVPPSRSSSATMAPAMAPLPPATTGHPSACPIMVSRSPNAPVSGEVRGAIEWAATPAMTALAGRGAESAHKLLGGKNPGHSEPGQSDRVVGDGTHGSEDRVGDLAGTVHERAHQPAVGRPVRTQGIGGRVQRSMDGDGGATVHRMGEGDHGLEELVTQLVERGVPEEGGSGHQWMGDGAEIVAKPGQGRRAGTTTTAGDVGPLEHGHRPARPGPG